MWYFKFLEHLAASICVSEARKAVLFIKQLITLVKREIYADNEFEPLFILGLVKDIFNFLKSSKNKDITLSQFAQRCVGLVILHAKSSDEEAIFSIDFIDVLKDKTIFNALNISKELAVLREEYLDGTCESDSVLSSSDLRSINEYIANRSLLIDYTLNNMLRQIEKKTFADLNYVVSVDLNYLQHVLFALSNQQKHPVPVLKSLHSFLLVLEHKDSRLDELIHSIENEIKIREQSEKGLLSAFLSTLFYRPSHEYCSRTFKSESENKDNCLTKAIGLN
ncbi:hypothetical protein ELY21_10620 [Legionella sp. km535]|uniref:hypothetical protein n=1 Tax=Legionella sp. km535 TaxID=2498107 RepID=UPI000F8D73FC|nr:hypothetical protein [Legionella sp. km535]RUR17755.1 hypothetical protein ELY21_10620 [Legionella sp. km535]